MNVYLIRCLTNLHAGSGDSNFGVIDNLVQRDTITNLPIVHSSSLKGALREHFESDSNNNSIIKHIFGSDNKTNPSEPGKYKFFQANLLAIPVQDDIMAYYLTTSPMLLKDFLETCNCSKPLETEVEDIINGNNQNNNYPALKNLLNCDNLKVVTDDVLKQICDQLPVIARNCLENGISQNLWYEEVVPRETRLYFGVDIPENDINATSFNTKLTEKNVQIGANASIGYGFCKISKIGG